MIPRDVVDLSRLNPSKAPFVELSSGSVSPLDPPSFVLGPMPDFLGSYMYGQVETGPVRCYRLADVDVTLDGLILDGPTAVASDWLNHPVPHTWELLRRLSASKERRVRRLPGRGVVLAAPGYHIYGHVLVDLLPRLFVLDLAGYDIRAERFILPDSAPQFVTDMLGLVGIGEHQLVRYDEQTEYLRVDELLVPTNLRLGHRFHSLMRSAVRFLSDAVAAALPASSAASPDRLFIGRGSRDRSRTLLNRPEIEHIATEAGYTVLRPEELALGEQIRLFQGARIVVGEYGSGLHNAIFAPGGSVWCALRGTSVHPGLVQSGLNAVLRQRLGYVLAATPQDAVDQDFVVPGTEFALALRLLDLLEQAR